MKKKYFNSIKSWSNLNNILIQHDIKNFCYSFSGIYLFLCTLSNNFYIGSALSKKFNSNRLYIRFRNHIKHSYLSNSILQKAIKKYGIENFEFHILELCQNDIVRERENFYLNILKPKYNILQYADTSLGYKHTQKTKEKLVLAWTKNPSRKEHITNLNKNKKLPLDVKNKLKQQALNRSQETKEKHKKACLLFNQKKFGKKNKIINFLTKKELYFNTLLETSKYLNKSYKTVLRYVKNKKVLNDYTIIIL